MVGIWQDIRHGGRSLLKASGLTAVIVLVLTIGIGANVAVFSVIDAALIRSLPYPQAEGLVYGQSTFEGRERTWVSALDYWDFRDRAASFEQFAAFSGLPRTLVVTGVERPERVQGLVVSHEVFPALRVAPRIGRGFSAEDELETAPLVAIVSHGYWQGQFGGDTDAVGGTVKVDGVTAEVIGVMPRGFHFRFDVDLWVPMRRDDPFIAERGKTNWSVVGRLAPGVPLAQAQSEVNVISAKLAAEYPDTNRDIGLKLTNLQEAWSENYRESLLMLQVVVALVLLIACGNVASLLLARGSARRTELSVRGALGASGARIARQLLTESLLLAGVAGLLGVLLAEWLQPLLLQLTAVGGSAIWDPGLSPKVLFFVVAVSLLTGLVFGTFPAWQASRGDLAQDLKSSVRTTDRGGVRFRRGLVVFQVAVSVVLLIGAGLLIRSLTSLMSVDLGFDSTNLATAEIQLPRDKYGERNRRIQFYTELSARLEAVPEVESVGLISQIPIRQPGNNEPVYDAEDPPVGLVDARSAYYRAVQPGYFEAMGIPLHAGRDIEGRCPHRWSRRSSVPLHVRLIRPAPISRYGIGGPGCWPGGVAGGCAQDGALESGPGYPRSRVDHYEGSPLAIAAHAAGPDRGLGDLRRHRRAPGRRRPLRRARADGGRASPRDRCAHGARGQAGTHHRDDAEKRPAAGGDRYRDRADRRYRCLATTGAHALSGRTHRPCDLRGCEPPVRGRRRRRLPAPGLARRAG
jgi:predicted permease